MRYPQVSGDLFNGKIKRKFDEEFDDNVDDVRYEDPWYVPKRQRHNHSNRRSDLIADDEWIHNARQGQAMFDLCRSLSGLTIRKKPRNILDLPAELRNKIYRSVFAGDEDVITVKTSKFPEPPLLAVCTQIQRDAGSIYYSESTFRVEYIRWATDAALIFNKKKAWVLGKFKIHLKIHKFIDSTPQWDNLLCCFRRVHKGYNTRKVLQQVAATGLSRAAVETEALFAMERAVIDSRDLPWARVERLLSTCRRIFILADSRWAE